MTRRPVRGRCGGGGFCTSSRRMAWGRLRGSMSGVARGMAVDAELRLYEPLFTKPDPEDYPEGADWKVNLTPNSETVLSGAKVEPSVKNAPAGTHYQFERQGYLTVDKDS